MIRSYFIKIAGLAISGLFIGTASKGRGLRDQDDLSPLLVDGQGNNIQTVAAWSKERLVIRKRWQEYLGIIPPNTDPPKIRVLKEDYPDGMIRQLIEYENEPGETAQAYIIRPEKRKDRMPGVIALHSTSDNQMHYIAGIEKGKISPMGLNLAKKGFVVLCPMCFLWRDKGERTYDAQVNRLHQLHPQSKGMAKMLFDARRAVDLMVNLKETDSSRIGAMGHSLGGKEAFYLGAFDDRVKVIVSNEGGIGIDFSNWDDSWYLGKEIQNFKHQHHELLALCAPKPFLLIGGDFADGVKSIPYINAVAPVYNLYGKSQNLKLFNHGQGHDITPEAEKLTYDWIIEHL
jgi:dienelactone hydrolase